jgi:hypothetical protein
MSASDGTNDLLAGFFGARRQGKSTSVKQFLGALKAPRLIIFDPMDEYGAHADLVRTLKELRALMRASPRKYTLRYCPPLRPGNDDDMKALPGRFDGFCSIALDTRDLTLVADELHLVTKPSWAPPGWSRCLTLGGHYGVRIIAVSHRPAQVDKVFFSLANLIFTCRLNFDDDVATLAGILGVPRAEVAALRPYQFIARDMVTGNVARGVTGVDAPLGRRSRRSAAPDDGRSPEKSLPQGARRSGRP